MVFRYTVMKHFLLFIGMVVLTNITVMAQTFTLQGRVVDESNKPLPFVSVSCLAQGKATFASSTGRYTLTLNSADSVVVKFSMLGYRSKTRVLRHPKGSMSLSVSLYRDNHTLEEVSVKGERIQTGQGQQLQVKDMHLAPSASGNGVEELIQGQAGVSAHHELSSQYNVRGGSFDENSVSINNVEIIRPFLVRSGQQEGLSIINPDMVEKIEFSTGGFEAKYGDKMSSSLDITYKTPQRFEANATASLLGASAYVGVATRHFSWANGLRYKTNQYLLNSLETDGEYKPNFLDYQTFLRYKPNHRWQVDFIGHVSDSHYNFYPQNRETAFGTSAHAMNFKVYFDGQEKDRFRTYSGTLTLRRLFAPHTGLSLLLSAFSSREQETYDIQGQYWLTETETTENLAVGTYFEHARNFLKAQTESAKLLFNTQFKKHQIETALTFRRERIKENAAEYEMRDSAGYSMPNQSEALQMIYTLRGRNRLDAHRMEAYLQDTWRFTSGNDSSTTLYTLHYGIRVSRWNFNKETIVSPRMAIGIIPAFNDRVTLRFATGLYYQAPFYKELRDTTTTNGFTTVNLNKQVKSQRSIHFIAGYDYRFRLSQRPFRFSAEAYYKILQRLIPYSINNVKVVYDAGQMCSGHATGIDLKLYGEFVPGTDSWLTFSLMNTRMNYQGKKIPLPTDQRWATHLFFTDYFPGTDRWKLSLRLSFADGLPFSAPHSNQDMNAFRAPAYKRADIGMSYRIRNNEDRALRGVVRNVWLGIDCLNLFGIHNVNSYYWITDVSNQQYAVPNFLTGRMLNARLLVEF